MHWVQTRIVLISPLGRDALMTCKFGKNRRRVMPVIFVPTPPRYLAFPRVSIMLPICGDFPQVSQALDMTDSSNAMKDSEKQLVGSPHDLMLRPAVASIFQGSRAPKYIQELDRINVKTASLMTWPYERLGLIQIRNPTTLPFGSLNLPSCKDLRSDTRIFFEP
jgi:hypothetical protein